MILQFLFKEIDHKNNIEEYEYKHEVIPNSGNSKGQVTKIIVAEKTIKELTDNCWVVQFKIESGNRSDDAKHLSNIYSQLRQYCPFILGNDSSEYYNQRLYPLINTFEMRLRKFLFLIFSLCNDKNTWRSVKNLDTIDFYTLYVRMFTSAKFNTKLNELFPVEKDKRKVYTKKQIQSLIDDIQEEDVMWDMVVKDRLNIVKENFFRIKSFRNDVMHSHNITYEKFKEAKSLFDEVNNALSCANDEIISFPENVNNDTAISNALDEILAEYGKTPMSVVEEWLNESGDDFKRVLKKMLDDIGDKSIDDIKISK